MSVDSSTHVANAVRLLRNGLSTEQVRERLIAKGISSEEADRIIKRAAGQLKAPQFTVAAEQAQKGIRVGVALVALGIAIFVCSGGTVVAAVPIGGAGLVLSVFAWLIYARMPGVAHWIETHLGIVLGVGLILAILLGIVLYVNMTF